MVYTYTPTYYSTLHDSITSLCKSILPFSFKKKRLPAAEHRLSKLQSDNLKWQQDSFHQILNLMGLHKEGIVAEPEVAAFRSHLLETLIVSPPEHEHQVILRDKLVFLQELLYAKCISEEEYHSWKRPLLRRLALQGAEVEARDVIVANTKDRKGGEEEEKEEEEEEWSVIDLKDENWVSNKDNVLQPRNKWKTNSAMKQIKGAASVFGFASSQKPGKCREEKSIFDVESKSCASFKKDVMCCKENPFLDSHMMAKDCETKSILMPEISQMDDSVKENGGSSTGKPKRKPFQNLFHKEQKEDQGPNSDEKSTKSSKKQWGFEGFKKWKRSDPEDETAPLPLHERSDSEAYIGSCHLMGEGPDTKQIKKKLHADGSPSDFFIDKVLGDKIKKELSRIQLELSTSNSNLKFSDDQIQAISTNLPVDKADLKKYFPKSWCDRYGDVVLDVVKKEFKEHVGEMEHKKNATREKRNNSTRWTSFEDDENFHPNLFADQKNIKTNPFFP